ncbi:MAG: hypothetical protein R3F53_20625 [Gammaproteobacteria bacterium]
MNIRNCHIKYRCTKTWENLIETEDQNIKYCNECDRGVHFCSTANDLLEAMKNDWCVAVDVESTDDLRSVRLLGDIGIEIPRE